MSFPISTHQLVPPDFSIITIHQGSGDALDPLPCALSSVADQSGIKSEQILLHLGGTSNLWNRIAKQLPLTKWKQHYTLRLIEGKSSSSSSTSLYEALPQATTRFTGTFVGFLAPEEQYLDGALMQIEKYFRAHPEHDIVLTGALIHEQSTNTITPQPIATPSLEYLWTSEPHLLASRLFFRSSLLKEEQRHAPEKEAEQTYAFNPDHHNMIFTEWVLRLLQAGKKVGSLNIPTTVSRSLSKINQDQAKIAFPPAPPIMKLLTPLWKWQHAYALQKAKRSFPKITPCMIYQLNALTQRTSPSDLPQSQL